MIRSSSARGRLAVCSWSGGGQTGRDHARWQRQADEGGITYVFDIHYSSAWRGNHRLRGTRNLLYPKGQEPKLRQILALWMEYRRWSRQPAAPAEHHTSSEQFHVLNQNGRLENFQAHMHLRGQRHAVTAILPNGPVAGC